MTTRKGKTLYLHVLDLKEGDRLWIPFEGKVVSARYLKGGKAAGYREAEGGLLLDPIPADATDEYDTVIAIEMGS